jgi:thiamine pyrophosphokinase
MGKTLGCLILAGGEIKSYEAVKAEIRADTYIICADSGFLHCEKLGVAPNLLLGDFDSLKDLPPDVERLDYPVEKNYTDSTLAIREAVKRGLSPLVLAGMLGGRPDHSLGNLQNLAWCAQNGVAAHITDGETRVWAVKDGEIILAPKENMYFSVFSLTTSCAAVSIAGAKYPLRDYPLAFDSPRAVSNEYAGEPVTVRVRGGAIAVLETPKNPLP